MEAALLIIQIIAAALPVAQEIYVDASGGVKITPKAGPISDADIQKMLATAKSFPVMEKK